MLRAVNETAPVRLMNMWSSLRLIPPLPDAIVWAEQRNHQ